jgi:hypothetical protein
MQRNNFIQSGVDTPIGRDARRRAPLVLLAGAVVALAACGDSTAPAPAATVNPATTVGRVEPVIDPGDGGRYSVEIDPARFTSVVDNPYLPLLPGTRREYRSEASDGEVEIIVVEVLDEHRTVMGVDTIVVHDLVTTEDGEVIEDTVDWYAQDADGNVWYFGEDTTAYENGVASKVGSWEGGVGGALPGIAMPASPAVTATGYRQEFLAGTAEDMGQVIAVGEPLTVAAGSYTDTIRTRDWTPLEPDIVEEKVYAAGVGFIYETKTSGSGPGETVELTALTPE